MVAQSTDDILRELDRTGGGPVQFEDPRTHARYVLIPQAAYRRVQPLIANGHETEPGEPVEWSEEKNARRCALIRRKHSGSLSADEGQELESLQDQMYRYRAQVAPLPQKLLEVLEAGLERLARAESRPAP
jgi:hypothetical protein